MGLSKGGFDILQAPDKAETGKSSGDPIMSKLKSMNWCIAVVARATCNASAASAAASRVDPET